MADRKKRILVVEDDDAIRSMEECILGASGYEVKSASSGNAGLEVARTAGPFDLFILDVMMPGLNGFDLARLLHGDATTRGVPILFATARGEQESMTEGFEIGASLYLVKPFTTATLLTMARAALAPPTT